jgi:hypothetical protein
MTKFRFPLRQSKWGETLKPIRKRTGLGKRLQNIPSRTSHPSAANFAVQTLKANISNKWFLARLRERAPIPATGLPDAHAIEFQSELLKTLPRIGTTVCQYSLSISIYALELSRMCGLSEYSKLRERIPLPLRQAVARKDPVRQPEWDLSPPADVHVRIRKWKTEFSLAMQPLFNPRSLHCPAK